LLAASSYEDDTEEGGQKLAVMQLLSQHASDSVVSAANVSLSVEYFGNATFIVRNLTTTAEVSLLRPADVLQIEQLLEIDSNRTQPGDVLCATVNVSYEAISPGNERFPLIYSNTRCHDILFSFESSNPKGKEKFLASTLGQGVLYGSCGALLCKSLCPI
jgi:hypothetical protein